VAGTSKSGVDVLTTDIFTTEDAARHIAATKRMVFGMRLLQMKILVLRTGEAGVASIAWGESREPQVAIMNTRARQAGGRDW